MRLAKAIAAYDPDLAPDAAADLRSGDAVHREKNLLESAGVIAERDGYEECLLRRQTREEAPLRVRIGGSCPRDVWLLRALQGAELTEGLNRNRLVLRGIRRDLNWPLGSSGRGSDGDKKDRERDESSVGRRPTDEVPKD